jgi:threonine synthase
MAPRYAIVGKRMYVAEVECSRCGAKFRSDTVLTLCNKCAGALLFRYDIHEVRGAISRSALKKREGTFWKFEELLPISSSENVVSLGEPYTPLLCLSQGRVSTL